MSALQIGFLHPGAMGISLAACAQNSGHQACWVSAGRSRQTRDRAAEHGLQEVDDLAALVERCSLIIGICPPHAADDVADDIVASGFRGVYADCNAISPQRAQAMARRMADAGIDFVDGGIVGPPAWPGESTWLYLSGGQAARVADGFSGGPLQVDIIGEAPGKASALKMCYAARTKGLMALLCAVVATADRLGVREQLERQWSLDQADLATQIRGQVVGVTEKAWRFSGEMDEIAATFEEAGLPGGFHRAASDVFERLAPFKQSASAPQLAEIIAALTEKRP